MIRNYAIAGVRHALRQKFSFFVSVGGLALGLCVCTVIGLYLKHELSFDQYHEKSERIYRLVHNEAAGEIPGTRKLATVGPPVGPAMKATFSQVEDAVRFRYTPDHIITYKDNRHYESKIFFVDPSVFNVFTFPLSKGNAATALDKPNSVVITAETAEKYFGSEDPLGKVITMDTDVALEVTGVLAPIPSNTHLTFDFLLPFDSFRVPFGYPVTLNDWGWISFHTYVLLKPGQDAKALESSIHSTLVSANWNSERAKKFRIQLQALQDIYLGDFFNEHVASGNKTYLSVLAGAGMLILVVAGFNFASMFSVLSIARAKEIGVRKVIGARTKSLALQIMGQAVFTAALAALLTSVVLPIAVGALRNLGIPIEADVNGYIVIFPVVLLVAILMGVASGLYPSIYLAKFNHQKLLKGSLRQSGTGMSIRNGMMLIQFIISIALICSVLVITRQVDYLMSKDLGYERDELMLLKVPGPNLRSRYPALKNQLMQNPHVVDVSIGGGRMDGDNGNVPITAEGQEESIPLAIDAVTFDFFRTIGIQPISGREFSENQPADTARGVIINLAAAKTFGWDAESAIGRKIRIGNIVLDGEVIGVVPDFHFGSLHSEITPLVLSYPRTLLQDVYVRFKSDDVRSVITSVAADWQATMSDLPFDYALMNQHLAGLYRSEQFFTILFRCFAVIAIIIACLGLYGLISQDIAYRVKEIGIRKVLGAGVGMLLALILRPVVILILLANVFAWPICWLMMDTWLNEFSYHTSLDWRVFPAGAAMTLVAAAIAVCQKAYAATRVNPVESLRSE